MTKQLSIRREVVEYGSVPVGAFLQQADGIAAIRTLLVQLSDRTGSGNECARNALAAAIVMATVDRKLSRSACRPCDRFSASRLFRCAPAAC